MTTPTEPLQFDLAEDVTPATATLGGLRCASCNAPLMSYFDVNGKAACAQCKNSLLAYRARPHLGSLLKAAGLGLCGAAAGAGLFYGIVALTGYQLGLVSIVVGLLVGFAVRRGSGGRGGWRYQALAIGLTYAAICSTYLPFIFQEIRSQRAAAAERHAQAPAAAEPPREPASLPAFLGAVAMLAGFTLALPFLGGASNIMGLVIIAIALYEAWKVNREAPLSVTGPLTVGARPNG